MPTRARLAMALLFSGLLLACGSGDDEGKQDTWVSIKDDLELSEFLFGEIASRSNESLCGDGCEEAQASLKDCMEKRIKRGWSPQDVRDAAHDPKLELLFVVEVEAAVSSCKSQARAAGVTTLEESAKASTALAAQRTGTAEHTTAIPRKTSAPPTATNTVTPVNRVLGAILSLQNDARKFAENLELIMTRDQSANAREGLLTWCQSAPYANALDAALWPKRYADLDSALATSCQRIVDGPYLDIRELALAIDAQFRPVYEQVAADEFGAVVSEVEALARQ